MVLAGQIQHYGILAQWVILYYLLVRIMEHESKISTMMGCLILSMRGILLVGCILILEQDGFKITRGIFLKEWRLWMLHLVVILVFCWCMLMVMVGLMRSRQ